MRVLHDEPTGLMAGELRGALAGAQRSVSHRPALAALFGQGQPVSSQVEALELQLGAARRSQRALEQALLIGEQASARRRARMYQGLRRRGLL